MSGDGAGHDTGPPSAIHLSGRFSSNPKHSYTIHAIVIKLWWIAVRTLANSELVKHSQEVARESFQLIIIVS